MQATDESGLSMMTSKARTQGPKMEFFKNSWKSQQILQKCLLTIVLLSGAFFLQIRLVYAVLVSVVLNFMIGDLTLKVLWGTLSRDLKGARGLLQLRMRMWRFVREESTVAKDFQSVVRRHPHKAAFLYEGQVWTFHDVQSYSNQIAHYFAKFAGLEAGDTVALFLMSRPEYVCLWLGISKAGCVASLINFQLRSDSLVHSLLACQAKAIVVGDELVDVVDEIRAKLPFLPIFSIGERTLPSSISLPSGIIGLDRLLATMPVDLPTAKAKSKGSCDRLFYIYTSGTTGLPKAAVITNARFFYLACGIKSMLRLRHDDVIYCTLPLYHTAGGILGVGQCLLWGSTVVLRKKFSASQFWLDCAKYNCTVGQYIGELGRYLLVQKPAPTDKLHNLRMMFGNGLKSEIWEQFQTRFGVPQMGEFYGATEGNASLTNIDNKIGAVGFLSRILPSAYPVMLIRIDSETGEPLRDGQGMAIRCKPGEFGELVGRIKPSGIQKFDGYSNGDATKKKIAKDVFHKGDLAFLSGDILVMDEFGYMFFRDRTGDTFRWRGENVSTTEVEGAISQIVGGLEAVVVFGVNIPEREGKAGMACLSDNATNFDLGKFNSDLKKKLPSYARPLFLRFLLQVDQTGTFKLIKNRLREEGFDPRKTADALFYLDMQNDSYRPLTLNVFAQICSGEIRY